MLFWYQALANRSASVSIAARCFTPRMAGWSSVPAGAGISLTSIKAGGRKVNRHSFRGDRQKGGNADNA